MAQEGDAPLHIPARQAVRVEYPGYVEDMNAVAETLGGPQGLTRAAALGNYRLPLKFRPGDSLCRAIVGEKSSIKGVLVKIPKGALQSTEPLDAQVVARVTSTYRFGALSDFQYVADASLPAYQPKQAESGRSLEEVMGRAHQPLLTVPPIFTRTEDALSYQFHSFYGTDNPILRGHGVGKAKGGLPPHVRKFSALNVPQALKETDFVAAHYSPAKWHILSELRRLFAERPVWSPLALQERIPAAKVTIDSDLLAKVSYVFRSGPFLSLWIRRGYDPRQERASGKYQATVFTLPADWSASLKRTTNRRPDDLDADADADDDAPQAALPPVSGVYSELCRFAAVPKQSAILQLCDVQDLQVSSLTSQTSQKLTACDKHTGWYDAAVLEKMEKRVQSRFHALLARFGFGGKTAPPADANAEEAAELAHKDTTAVPREGPDSAAAAPEPERASTAEGAGEGIFPEAMLEGLDNSLLQPNTAGGGDTAPPAASSENAEGGAEPGTLGGGQGAEEDFLIFEASSSGSEAGEQEEEQEGEQEEAEEEEEEEEDDDDDDDDDEMESSEEEDEY